METFLLKWKWKLLDNNTNLGGLFRGLFSGEGWRGVKLPPTCLKFVRIVLETWKLGRNYTPISSFRIYTSSYQGPLNFANVSIFCKISAFFEQNSTFTQSDSVRAVLGTFQFCFPFSYDKRLLLLLKVKVLQTMRSETGFQIAPN